MRALAAGCIAVLALTATAAEPAKPAKTDADKSVDIRTQISKKLPGSTPDDVRATPIPGIYEVSVGKMTLHITADGKYVIAGDLYDLATEVNLTEKTRGARRVKALAAIKDSETIVFGNAAAKHTLTVFTDTDCGYCRKLHSEIAELNRLGIRVRYLAYPRGGPGSESWATMESVWCAKDRRDALTRAKLGEPIAPAKCGATPVTSQFRLGDEMGVDGTPAIFTETGEQVGGYLPPQTLLSKLEQLRAPTPTAAAK